MPAQILYGKPVAEAILEKSAKSLNGGKAAIAVVSAGKDGACEAYFNSIRRTCEKVGITFYEHILSNDCTERDVIKTINGLNSDPDISGILINMPLPKNMNASAVCEAVAPEKDIDCVTSVNFGKLAIGQEGIAPCTAAAVIETLDYYGVDIKGKKCAVIGRSNVVGKPLALMLLARSATVTVCHSATKNLSEITRQADIIIAAVGKANFVTGDMISQNTTVIDVGINILENGTLCGDVDFDDAVKKAKNITPVPGGIGAVTTAVLIANAVKSFKR